MKVKLPRLRHKCEGEVNMPAHETLRQDRGLQQHMLGALMRGISTREYDEAVPKIAETVGVSRSSVSRTGKITRWRDQEMVERWVASAWLLTENHFRRIDGHANLWALAVILGRKTQPSVKEKVA